MSDTSQTASSADIDALVDRWHADMFTGSPVARDTETWNLVHAAKEDLKARLGVALHLQTTQDEKVTHV